MVIDIILLALPISVLGAAFGVEFERLQHKKTAAARKEVAVAAAAAIAAARSTLHGAAHPPPTAGGVRQSFAEFAHAGSRIVSVAAHWRKWPGPVAAVAGAWSPWSPGLSKEGYHYQQKQPQQRQAPLEDGRPRLLRSHAAAKKRLCGGVGQRPTRLLLQGRTMGSRVRRTGSIVRAAARAGHPCLPSALHWQGAASSLPSVDEEGCSAGVMAHPMLVAAAPAAGTPPGEAQASCLEDIGGGSNTCAESIVFTILGAEHSAVREGPGRGRLSPSRLEESRLTCSHASGPGRCCCCCCAEMRSMQHNLQAHAAGFLAELAALREAVEVLQH